MVPTEKPALEFTGERFTPECVREIWYEHFHRYVVARAWVRGRQVLDAACGEGYGSALLADAADRVTGVDISETAIGHAQERYREVANLDFQTGDCTRLDFPDRHFDGIVSFETLEHLAEQEAMLGEFRRVLKPDGLLILSSPDREQYSEQAGHDNPYHVKELNRAELETLLSRYFPAYRLLGQKLIFQSAIWDLGSVNRVSHGMWSDMGQVSEGGGLAYTPVYYIAVCAQSADCLPATDEMLWLFGDQAESVYRHYYHEIRKNMDAGRILAERDAEIEALKKALDEQRHRPGLLKRLFRRRA